MSYALLVRLEKGISIFYFDTCRWQFEEVEVEEGDAEAVGEATTHYHQPLTNKAFMEANIAATATIA